MNYSAFVSMQPVMTIEMEVTCGGLDALQMTRYRPSGSVPHKGEDWKRSREDKEWCEMRQTLE